MKEEKSSTMYREHILDLYKNPLNFGKLENPTNSAKKNNPLCGDEIEIQLVIKDNIIKEVKFNGVGCAISSATTSLLTEKIKNKSLEEVKDLNKDDILNLIEIPISPGRIKCVLISLDVLKEAIKDKR